MGWKHGTLSKRGIKQAKLISKRLKDIPINVIYTSDLKRCVETAKEIAKFHKNTKLIKEKALRERSKGIYEGTKKKTQNWTKTDGDLFSRKAPKGESLIDARKRLKKFYDKIVKKYNDETVLIVGHNTALKVFQTVILSKDIKYFTEIERLENAALSEFEVDKEGKAKILLWNCKKHL